MSEWKSVLKSTSIEKQTSNEVMDKFVENLGKVIADYQKEQRTNQSTTATQPTQPTQAPSVAGRANTISVGGNKPASGYKTYTSEEIQALRGAGVSTSEIKRLDAAREKNMKKPITGQMASRQPSATQQPFTPITPQYTVSQANIDRAKRRLPPWMQNLRADTSQPPTTQVTQQEGQPATTQVRDSYDKEGPSGFGVAAPPKQSISRTQILSPAERRKRNIKGKQARQAGLGNPIEEGRKRNIRPLT